MIVGVWAHTRGAPRGPRAVRLPVHTTGATWGELRERLEARLERGTRGRGRRPWQRSRVTARREDVADDADLLDAALLPPGAVLTLWRRPAAAPAPAGSLRFYQSHGDEGAGQKHRGRRHD